MVTKKSLYDILYRDNRIEHVESESHQTQDSKLNLGMLEFALYIYSLDSPISISLHILQVPTYEVSVWFFVNRFVLPYDSLICCIT